MPPDQKKTSPALGPRYCPKCRLAERDDFAAPLCRECGGSLIPQGYCPVCEDRWLLGVGALCPKHDVVLEAAPPISSEPITSGRSTSWVTVTVFPNSLAAAVPRARLEAEGIPTFLDGERMGALGFTTWQPASVKLQVPANRVADARIILSQSWSLPSDEKADFEDLV
ncbi:MAG: hypothetical protein ACHRXM_29730 [Isosphaerales bacterium]